MTELPHVLLADIQALLEARPPRSALVDLDFGRILVGITGPPGAGKSHVAAALADELGHDLAALIPMDGFHLSNAELDRLGRRDRKGAVDTFDTEGYVATLRQAMGAYRVADIAVPGFDRVADEPVPDGLVVPAAARVVITEGNYLGLKTHGWRPVWAMLDKLYYVDCPAPVRYERLVRRHTGGGGSQQDARAWVEHVDEPNARLVATTRDRCDRVFEIG